MKLPRGTENHTAPKPPDAKWMEGKELAAYEYKRGSILLGRHEGRWIGSADDRHLMTVAGSRAGKSSTCLKPNLKRWEGSVLCIDPKGELAMETALDREAMGQDVIILDPFHQVKGPAEKFRKRFDPLSEISAGSEDDIIDNAALIADALIIPYGSNASDHWTMSAKNFVRGLILYGLYLQRKENRPPSLSTVRKWITAPLGDGDDDASADDENGFDPDRDTWLSTRFTLMSNVPDFGGVIAGVGGTMKGKPKGEKGSIISTAVEQTAFLDSDPMESHLGESDFATLRQLKRAPTTIYLVLPASRMATHFRWLRVIITLAMAALENEKNRLELPVLFILEEFPQLGYMKQIEAAAGLMAGYGVKIWSVLQDLSQLKSQYRDSWETFIGNAGVMQAFGNTDTTTLDYISHKLGNTALKERKSMGATPSTLGQGGLISQENATNVPLLAPFEVAQYGVRDGGKQFIMFAGKPPAYIDRLSHEEV